MANSAQVQFDYQEWEKLLKEIRGRWSDLTARRAFGGIIAATVMQDIVTHFDREEGPTGPWAVWSVIYHEHLEKIGRQNNKILQFSGQLRQKITPNAWRPVKDGILFFNNAKTKSGFPYAEHHNEGKSDGKKPRPFMWLSDKAMSNILERTVSWLAEGRGAA